MKCHTLDYPQLLKLLSGPKTNAAVVLFRSPKLVPLTTHGNPLLLVPIAAHSVASRVRAFPSSVGAHKRTQKLPVLSYAE